MCVHAGVHVVCLWYVYASEYVYVCVPASEAEIARLNAENRRLEQAMSLALGLGLGLGLGESSPRAGNARSHGMHANTYSRTYTGTPTFLKAT